MNVNATLKRDFDEHRRFMGLYLIIKYKDSEKKLFSRRLRIRITSYNWDVYDDFVQEAYQLYKDDGKLKQLIEEKVKKDIEFRRSNKTSNDLIRLMKNKKIHIVMKNS